MGINSFSMKLGTYIELKKISKTRAAKELQITRTYLYEILGNRMIPGRKLAQKISQWSQGDVRYEDLWQIEQYPKLDKEVIP
jgi:hypothetical protein